MEGTQSPADWFEVWFDSDHYHQLYGHRSNAEARAFMESLHAHGGWDGLSLLDLACGKGRHARAAARLGHEVVGLDLSRNSIEAARLQSADLPRLSFEVGDMRDFALGRSFDGVLNLFTSFGYFSHGSDHMAVLERIHAHLNPGGFLILDFLEADFARKHLVPRDVISRNGVDYHIERHMVPTPGEAWETIVKQIRHRSEEGQMVVHEERVAALEHRHLQSMLNDSGFTIQEEFGQYDLTPWTKGQTPRLILSATRS